MPKRKVDPLGRNHGTVQKPTNRANVDSVCYYVLNNEEKDFHFGEERPSVNSVYYDAYMVIYGTAEANKMLRKAQEKFDEQ